MDAGRMQKRWRSVSGREDFLFYQVAAHPQMDMAVTLSQEPRDSLTPTLTKQNEILRDSKGT